MKFLFSALACIMSFNAHAAISVVDDSGRTVTLQKPAMRVIALAPHAVELVYAAGGGARMVAASDYSDYPEQANLLPRVGSNLLIDMERIVALKPDLIVVWHNGNSARQLEALRVLGVPMFHSEPRALDAIPASLVRLGKLMGTEAVADAAAANQRRQLAALKAKYGGRPPVRIFYQMGENPMYTLNGGHIVSDAIRLCGGENVFAAMKVTAPIVGIESVLQEDPEAILGGLGRGNDEGGIAIWKAYPGLAAVRRGNLFRLDSKLLNRAGPRMIGVAASLCEKLEQARQRRPAK